MKKFMSWKKDSEGDLVFVVFGLLNFTKYKEHVIFSFGVKGYESAGKNQGREE